MKISIIIIILCYTACNKYERKDCLSMAVKYAFDGDDSNVRKLTNSVSSLSYQELNEYPANLTYTIDAVRLVPDADLRQGIGRPFGRMSVEIRTHLASLEVDNDTYFVIGKDGRSHDARVDEDGSLNRLSSYRTHQYHINNGEMKHAMNAGAYDDFDRFNAEISKSLTGTTYSVAGKVTLTKESLVTDGNIVDYVQVDKVEEPEYLDENADTNFDLLFLSGITKVQSDYERRSTLRERSDAERAEALANSHIQANDISYEREDVGNELDLGDVSNPDADVNTSSSKDDEKSDRASHKDDDISDERRRTTEGRDMSYNPDADDELDL